MKFKQTVFSDERNLRNIEHLDECVSDGLIIVRNLSGNFFRAQIIERPQSRDSKYLVRLIDFGNNVYCDFKDFYTLLGRTLRERQNLLKEVFRYPPMCFEAKLAKCKPDVVYQTGWSKNAIDKFTEIVGDEKAQGRKIGIKAYSFNNYDKVAAVILNLEKIGDRPGTINQMLTDYKYSQIANESYLYQISRATDENKIESKNEHFDFNDYSDLRFWTPKEKIPLIGPLSTFQHNIFERTTHYFESEVSIDPWSANSILVDPFPFDGIRKVMIATSRNKNDKGKIILRHTTVLPHVTGMPCLLALIFCPTAELRCDKHFNRYTSVLTGEKTFLN